MRLALAHRAAQRVIPPMQRLDGEGWAAVYGKPASPIHHLSSPVARIIAGETEPGDVVLEAGCGSATVSAELASADRKVQLLDFSDEILKLAADLFRRSGLPDPALIRCDLTKRISLADDSVDVVWSSGVLEHWNDEDIVPIVAEMTRIARKKVVSLVPCSACLFYRLSKALAEEHGLWPYGVEMPRLSLRPVFEGAGLRGVTEKREGAGMASQTLRLVDPVFSGPDTRWVIEKWWQALSDDDPLKREQGYLLLTVGHKAQ